jgi:transcriptional regulator with XRE-family HTH domain
MPRPNKPRTLEVESEANVAERVAYEREALGLSYEALAKRMTERGCPIASSAIFRIEKGNPPRHITVDELVAFKEVFGTTINDLLAPMELIRQDRARQLASRTREAFDSLPDAVFQLCEVVAESSELARTDSELFEFYRHQWETESGKVTDVPLPPQVVKAITALINTVTKFCRDPEVAAAIRAESVAQAAIRAERAARADGAARRI